MHMDKCTSTHTHTHTCMHTHTHTGKTDYSVASEGVTKHAMSGPFVTFCHHVVTKHAGVTKRAGCVSNLTVTKCATVTKCTATSLFIFWRFICCLSVILLLDKGDFPENVHVKISIRLNLLVFGSYNFFGTSVILIFVSVCAVLVCTSYKNMFAHQPCCLYHGIHVQVLTSVEKGCPRCEETLCSLTLKNSTGALFCNSQYGQDLTFANLHHFMR